MDDNKTFGELFKKLRKDKKLTQKMVAKELGLGQSAIANYEQGTRFPDEKTLRKIAIYLDTSLDYLMNIKRVIDIGEYNQHVKEIMEEYKNLIISNQYPKALEFILSYHNNGVELIKLYEEILLPVLKHTGMLWESSIIDVAKEHLISEEIEKTVGILSYKTSQNEIKKIKCVCVTAGSELHRIPIKMISELLKKEGYQTWYPGINTPTKDIVELCKKNSVDVLIISSTMDSSLDSVNNIITALRLEKSLSKCKVIVGGASFNRNNKAWELVNADCMVKTISDAISLITKN